MKKIEQLIDKFAFLLMKKKTEKTERQQTEMDEQFISKFSLTVWKSDLNWTHGLIRNQPLSHHRLCPLRPFSRPLLLVKIDCSSRLGRLSKIIWTMTEEKLPA